MNTNPSSFQRWLLPGIISVVAALVLTFLLVPLIAGQLNVPLPQWMNQWANPVFTAMGISDERLTQGDTDLDSTEPVEANDAWPAPPDDILAASTTVTGTLRSSTPTPDATTTPFPTSTAIVLPTPSWSEMNHLVSVKFTAATVVEAERATTIAILGDITTDRLLLKAVGEILVGVDLDKIANVNIDGRSIRISLPSPEILAVEILPKESQIYDSASTIFLSQYDGLETEALEQARQQLRIEIMQNEGLMELARDKTRLQLTEFLESVGFDEIKIDFPYLDSQSRG